MTTDWKKLNRDAGRLVGAPAALRWSDGSAALYAEGLVLRVLGAGAVVALAGLLLACVALGAVAPVRAVAALVYGAAVYLSAVLLYPNWGRSALFHVAFVITMGILVQSIIPAALVGRLTLGYGWAYFTPALSLALGMLIALEVLGWIVKVIAGAFDPPRVLGGRDAARYLAYRARRSQRKARRAQRADHHNPTVKRLLAIGRKLGQGARW